MLKIAIIDDSAFDTNRIIQILKQIQSNTEIQSYNSITSFLASKNNCDFLLLDIELDKEDGIYESSKCRSLTKYIIYVSAISDRMQEAFAQNVIGYILKSDDDNTIQKVLTKLIHQYTEKNVCVKTMHGLQNIPLSSIYKITRENRKIFVYLHSSNIRIFDTNLKCIYEQSKDSMIWIDRSIMVNYRHISEFNDSKITLDNQSIEYVSIRRKQIAFHEYLQKIFQNI